STLIRAYSVGGTQAASNSVNIIRIAAPIVLTSDLPAINLPSGASLTIAGVSGATGGPQRAPVDGPRQYRGFLGYAGALALENLTIQNAVARGGDGGTGASGGGGGGAGLGGGVFVASGGSVRLVNVDFNSDQAIGGNGGDGTFPIFGGNDGGGG